MLENDKILQNDPVNRLFSKLEGFSQVWCVFLGMWVLTLSRIGAIKALLEGAISKHKKKKFQRYLKN